MESTNKNKPWRKLKSILVGSSLSFAFLSILLGVLVGAVLLKGAGFPVIESYGAMFNGVFTNGRGFAWSVVRATPLILTGLSVMFAFKTGLFNIGAEGQYIVGSIGAAMVGAFFPVSLPAIFHVPITFLSGIFLAGIWGALAGVLKAKFQIHEVISTIMLNWISLYALNYIVTIPGINKPNSEASYSIKDTAKIYIDWFKPVVGIAKINWGTIIAILAAFLVGYILYKTTIGYELRAVGYNKFAAEYGGIKVNKSIISSMFIAGMLSGAAGAIMVMGNSFNIARLAAMEGYGFDGIAVALIGNNTPIGSILAAFLFGALRQGATSMQRITGAPTEMINIIIGTIVFFISIPNFIKMFFFPKTKRRK